MKDKDRDYLDEEFERERGERRPSSREGYITRSDSNRDYDRDYYPSPENYEPPLTREGYEREPDYDRARYERGYGYDRFGGAREAANRYEPRKEPRHYEARNVREGYEPNRADRPDRSESARPEYADRNRTEWSHTTAPTTKYGVPRSQLRCRDIMTSDVIACRRDTNIREVAKVMRDEDTGVMPVVDDKDRIIGVVTDRDLVIRLLADKDVVLDGVTVADAMSDKVYTVRPTDRIVDCIRKMGDKQVRRIIVTDDNKRLKGIISMSDVAIEAEYDRELENALEEISKPKSWFKRLFS